MKRAFDITIGSALLLLTVPLVLIGALISLVQLGAFPLFAQDRVGRGGESFKFIKLRTLPADVGAYLDKHQLDGLILPRGCRLMRRLHLDELPQLLLVVLGRMSLVGPRPEMRHLHDEMPDSFAAERTSVKPGCTGLWQISESCVGLISNAPHYDSFYLRNQTLRLDAWILARTALKMLGLGRPVSLDSVPAWTMRGSRPSTDDAAIDVGAKLATARAPASR